MPTLTETITPEKRIRRITVLISGSGSNLQALLDASLTDKLPNAQVTYVLSSRSNAYGLERAANASPPVPTSVCALKTFLNRNPGSSRVNYDAEVARRVLESRPDIVVLAGWMHILSDSFLDILNGTTPPPAAPALPPPTKTEIAGATEPHHPPSSSLHPQDAALPTPPLKQAFPIPCINLHPALPGAFDGANAIGRAFEAFQKDEIKHTGVMIHRVIKEVDRGEPLVVRNVDIKTEDKIEDLEQRIHSVEHEIIVEGARLILDELEKLQLVGAETKEETKEEATEAKEDIADKLERVL
ncbi:Phosphoribosylglycinamide formyltransferase [Vanrija pseudolonga]|uniref:phosphoribosylglycinamide formyltransferase 1 n=1 Tax=Vanrija pseudolonga TaxID=143232 RepID=A0AAF1BLD1_9TREE|nr:Phosphoribosylglycinamide formyltransferase [Vanrija pseudolonga]